MPTPNADPTFRFPKATGWIFLGGAITSIFFLVPNSLQMINNSETMRQIRDGEVECAYTGPERQTITCAPSPTPHPELSSADQAELDALIDRNRWAAGGSCALAGLTIVLSVGGVSILARRTVGQ